jgi:hypothetical protein
METNDVNARLAALQARRQPAAGTTRPAARINAVTGRQRKHHPARKARIATGAMSVVAMFGITGYMAAHDAAAAATSGAASVTPATNATSAGKSVTAATAATATKAAATTTKGS